MPSMTENVPAEIWLYIARYIPEDSLRNLSSVNRIFFHLAMDARYKDILIKSHENDTLKIIVRLSDPFVAKRVRTLELQLNPSPSAHLPSPSTSTAFKDGLKAALWFGRRSPSPSPKPAEYTPIETLLTRLSAVFPVMTNLQEFSVSSWNWPIECDLLQFFTLAWCSFGRNLRKFSLSGNLDGLRVVLNSGPIFSSLQELVLEFTNHREPSLANTAASVLIENVAPFVNSLAPQLLSFKVQSFASMDLSYFFKELNLPNLHTLFIHAPFNRSFSEDPSGLTRLLTTCSTLKDLQIRLKPAGVPHPASEPEQRLSEWLTDTFVNNSFLARNLHTLRIYPSSAEIGIDTLVTCLDRSSHSLRKLVIYDRYLKLTEISRIVADLPLELTSLGLNALVLSVTLLDLLANRLPNLDTLTLYVAKVMAIDEQPSTDFVANISQRTYSSWRLNDLTIWLGGTELDHETRDVIRNCIPSLSIFCGNYLEV